MGFVITTPGALFWSIISWDVGQSQLFGFIVNIDEHVWSDLQDCRPYMDSGLLSGITLLQGFAHSLPFKYKTKVEGI